MEYKIDPNRKHINTGIYIRAKSEGLFGSYDIAELDLESMNHWLRSRGGENAWAENVVLTLLGYTVDGDADKS